MPDDQIAQLRGHWANPVPHAMESGTPHARYAVVTRGHTDAWSAELRALAYDWDGAARQARGHNHPNTARWVATGRA